MIRVIFGIGLLLALHAEAGIIYIRPTLDVRLDNAKRSIVRDWALRNPRVVSCLARENQKVSCDFYYEQQICVESTVPDPNIPSICRKYVCLERFGYDETMRDSMSEVSYGCE